MSNTETDDSAFYGSPQPDELSVLQLWNRYAHRTEAIAAFQRFAELAGPKGNNSLSRGVISLPRDWVISHSNADPSGEPFLHRRINIAPQGDAPSMELYIYDAGHSLLWVREPSGGASSPMLRLIPVVYSLRPTFKVQDGSIIFPSLSCESLQFAQAPLMHDEIHPANAEEFHGALIRDARTIELASRSWPLIGNPHHTRSPQGIFGKDIPSPSPEMDGKPYAWPAVLPYQSHTPQEISDLTAKLETTLVRIQMEFPDIQQHPRFILSSSELRQAEGYQSSDPKDFIPLMDPHGQTHDRFHQLMGPDFIPPFQIKGWRDLGFPEGEYLHRAALTIDTSRTSAHQVMEAMSSFGPMPQK